MDSFLLNTIVEHFNKGNWKATRIPTATLHEACGAVNEAFGCRMSWEDVYDRFQFFQTRFRTFTEIIRVPETHWDLHMNCIIAVDHVWERIFKKNKFTKAYYYRGEPEYEKLAILFGPDTIKIEGDPNVIVISDTTIHKGEENNELIVVSDDEEVTSPMPNQESQLRRRLFDDEPQLTDLQSTNNIGRPYFNLSPTMPRFSDANPPNVPGSSSCASSSPSKWWKNPFN